MAFNLDLSALSNSNDLVAKASTSLKGDAIHRVKIKSVEVKASEKGNGSEFVEIIFEDKDGLTYKDFTFKPGEPNKYFERKAGQYGNNPSQGDNTAIKIALFIQHLSPSNWDKIKAGKLKLGNPYEWEGIKNFAKVMNAAIKEGEWVDLKLVKNNKGYASLPFYTRLVKKGDEEMPTVSNNFICNSKIVDAGTMIIEFTSKELEAIEKRKIASPTKPSLESEAGLNIGTTGGSENLSLDASFDDLPIGDDDLDLA